MERIRTDGDTVIELRATSGTSGLGLGYQLFHLHYISMYHISYLSLNRRP